MTKRTRQRPDAQPQDLQAKIPAPTTVYRDKLLRVLLVVERGGRLYLVPRRPDGWQARQEITMTDAAKAERLTVARDMTPGELGIPSEKTVPQDAPESTRTGKRDQRIGPRPDALDERLRDVLPTGGTVRELANIAHGGRESESDS